MIELIIGAILGTLGSLAVSHFYYRRSSQDFEKEVDRLRSQLSKLQELMDAVQSDTVDLLNDVAKVKKIAGRGTPDDPDYPYK